MEELQATNTELETRSADFRRLDAYQLGVLNSMEQSIFVTDRSLVVTNWNQGAERMWGPSAEQAVGRELMTLPLGDVTRMLRPALDTALKREIAVEVAAVPYTLPGGAVRDALVKILPLRNAVGAVIGIIGIATADGASGTRRR